MILEVIKHGELNGDYHRLERRRVHHPFKASTVYVITDWAGDLYAFLDRDAALSQWRFMGIRALAQQEVA